MTNYKSDFRKLRGLLQFVTLLQVANVFILFSSSPYWVQLDNEYHLRWIVLGLTQIVGIIFIWYTWTKMPFERKDKINKTLMIFFLGIIGMWLWLPSKTEMEKLPEE